MIWPRVRPRVKPVKPRVEWHEDKASLGGSLFYCPGGAEEFSPGFQPWETSKKAFRPERARDGVGEMPFECYRKELGIPVG